MSLLLHLFSMYILFVPTHALWNLYTLYHILISQIFTQYYPILVGRRAFSFADSLGKGHQKPQRNSRWCQKRNSLIQFEKNVYLATSTSWKVARAMYCMLRCVGNKK